MTKAEIRHQDAVREIGCIACLPDLWSPAEIHHVLSGGRRKSEYDVIGLCQQHHRGGRNDEHCVSRHPWRKAFEARYGTEAELLAETQRRVAEMRGQLVGAI